ncbi:hypothetical protein [Mammaliicoccus lentus]|uniref:hypothetical protein n=1 Tax=Mammaliicoccus lentus TaxID=42858 RepID=UPI001C4FC1E1|nr:hypothetical protein [Mammaliicoccus lentus]MBW0761363.1 hypothetical protein [Mammaliicoccus lentus]
MAYEYKEEIENHIIVAPVHVYDEVLDELDEVYAKAKAFNEILNVDIEQHEIIVHGQVEDIVNKYMEDK